MDTISPVVITSKAADEHINTIKMQHSDLLQGMQDQQTRVTQYHAQKQADFQAEQQVQRDQQQQEKENNININKQNAESQAKILAEQNKAKELEIKQQALSMP